MRVPGPDLAARIRAASRLLAGAAALAFAAAIIPACANGGGEPFRPAFAPEGAGVIYIFRTGGGGPFAGGRLPVFVDQRPAGEIGAGEYIAWGAGEGEHLVRVEGDSEASARVELLEGQSAFLEIRTEAFGSKPIIERRGEDEGLRLLGQTREAPVAVEETPD